MARTEAEDRAIRKYEAEKIDKIMIRVPKGIYCGKLHSNKQRQIYQSKRHRQSDGCSCTNYRRYGAQWPEL